MTNLYACDVVLKTGADHVAEEKHIVIYEGNNFAHPLKIASVNEAANLALGIIACFSHEEQSWFFDRIQDRMHKHAAHKKQQSKKPL